MTLLDNRFCGRMFLVNRPGFTFTHYLDIMFPPIVRNQTKSGLQLIGGILNEVPQVDVATAEKREFMAVAMAGLKMGNSTSATGMGKIMDGMIKDSKTNGTTDGMLIENLKAEGMKGMMIDSMKGDGMKGVSWSLSGEDSVAVARMNARECEGKTVRQLSRLWRYVGGSRPIGEGVGMMNGVGLGVLGIDMAKISNGNVMNGGSLDMGLGNLEMNGLKGMEGKDMRDNPKGTKHINKGKSTMRNGAVGNGIM